MKPKREEHEPLLRRNVDVVSRSSENVSDAVSEKYLLIDLMLLKQFCR